jgi:predicted DNA-binding protein (UPF0251 family)
MSLRIRVLRKVLNPPIIDGFKPYGQESEKRNLDAVNLLFEEYEAIRLSDYNKLNHHQASVMMGVSRPTFTRIYASALQNVAKAFVEGRQIIIKGGKVYFDRDWYHCGTCMSYFNNPKKDKIVENCYLCGSMDFKELNHPSSYKNTENCNAMCYCPDCGFEQKHEHGKNCNEERCPDCNSTMKRKF